VVHFARLDDGVVDDKANEDEFESQTGHIRTRHVHEQPVGQDFHLGSYRPEVRELDQNTDGREECSFLTQQGRVDDDSPCLLVNPAVTLQFRQLFQKEPLGITTL